MNTTDASNLLKKIDDNTKIRELESKINNHDHAKYITTQEFNRLTLVNFASRLTQASLVGKNAIANFVKKTDFDDKLKYLNKKVISNEIKHVLVKNELNKLFEKVKSISTKGLTKDLINKYTILHGTKYFYSGILQNYFVFIPAKKYIKFFGSSTEIYS